MTPAAAAEARERTLRVTELLDAWPVLAAEERLEVLRLVPDADAEDVLLSLPARDQAELILETSPGERRSWMRLLPPDDAADVVQAAPQAEREGLLALLDEPTRKEVAALLAYAEDDAGGLMNPRYARLRPDMSVDEAITYLRRQARERLGTIYYMYVLDAEQALLGVEHGHVVDGLQALARLAAEVGDRLVDAHVGAQARVARVHEPARVVLGIGEERRHLLARRLVQEGEQPLALGLGRRLHDVGSVVGREQPHPRAPLAGPRLEDQLRLVAGGQRQQQGLCVGVGPEAEA